MVAHETFVKPAVKLDYESQQHIYHMISFILRGDKKLEDIDDDYYKVLFEKARKYLPDSFLLLIIYIYLVYWNYESW